MRSAAERFEEKFSRGADDECWPWTAYCMPSGYAQFCVSRQDRHAYAHRFSYELYVGPIPEGLEIDHLCRNKGCVNPAHLEPVTHQENQRRAGPFRPRQLNVGDSCRAGHPRSPENTGVNKQGSRFCRPCRREAVRRHRRKIRR